MFGSLFRRKHQTPKGEFLTARLNARLQPLDRGEHFEDPLNDVLEGSKLGQVTGGGTQLADEPAGIEFCDLEIRLNAIEDAALDLIAKNLETLGAPKGSKLIVDRDGREVDFGASEGLALFLNGVDLPDSVYEECDVNDLIEQLTALLKTAGKYMSHWQGSRETGLYFYGRSFSEMKEAIKPVVEQYPLCEKSRIEQIA